MELLLASVLATQVPMVQHRVEENWRLLSRRAAPTLVHSYGFIATRRLLRLRRSFEGYRCSRRPSAPSLAALELYPTIYCHKRHATIPIFFARADLER
jgi:hypothetical protein